MPLTRNLGFRKICHFGLVVIMLCYVPIVRLGRQAEILIFKGQTSESNPIDPILAEVVWVSPSLDFSPVLVLDSC